MKIAIDARFLTHPQVGGFKTYTQNLVNALSQVDNNNSYVIYLDRPPLGVNLPDCDNFTYKIVECTFPMIGVPVREQIKLRQEINQDQPDVVHYLCNTATVNLSQNYVVTLHDAIQLSGSSLLAHLKNGGKLKPWLINQYSKWSILKSVRGADRVITVSNYEKKILVEKLDLDLEKISVVHEAPNPIFQPAAPETKHEWCELIGQKLGVHGPYILGVGYDPRKNIPLLIVAFSQIADKFPNLNLVVVAANEIARDRFKELAAEHNIQDRVILLPALPLNDLIILYNLAEVFVFPSEREGFGLPPLEAMACGTPAIAMNASSIPEVVQDGAYLVDGKEIETWSKAIEQVITDKSLRSDLILRGQQQVARMTWQRCALDTLEIYQLAARGSGKAHPVISDSAFTEVKKPKVLATPIQRVTK